MDPIKFPLVIKRRMEVKKLEEVLTKLRASNPSKRDETELLLQMIKWLTYDETRLHQFSHLINQFNKGNIDTSVMINMFRKTPILVENEYTLAFYRSTLESNILNIVHGNQMVHMQDDNTIIRKEKEDIQRTFESATSARLVIPLEQYNVEFPCHPMNSVYNTNSPKFDPSKLFSLLKL